MARDDSLKTWLIVILSVVGTVLLGLALFMVLYEEDDLQCNYNNPDRTYIDRSSSCVPDYLCQQDAKAFKDACGCGCERIEMEEPEQHFCFTRPEVCTKIYKPVCGWFDPSKIQCIRYPCAQTFGNECEACASENVISWTDGVCPT